MTVKLIALDLDGTTLNSKGRLSPGNKAALQQAIAAGVNVVIATGRCFTALPEDILEVEGINYVITSNGALLSELHSGKSLYHNCIDEQAVLAAEKILSGYKDLMIEVFVQGEAFIEKEQFDAIKAGRQTNRHRQYVLTTRKPMPDLMGFLRNHAKEIENINIFFETQEEKQEMHPVLLSIEHATVTTSLDNNWEIGGETTSKASALHELCRLLDVKKEEVMACGDSPNDGEMLKEAGIPVAVGNAKEVIKELAVFISGTNDEDGVATAINKYVLAGSKW
ncbi:MAG: HAD family hydrolase [Anaerovoracaceae bacterium]